MDKDNYQLLIDKALKFLSFRPRSKSEVVGKLRQFSIKKGIGKKVFREVIIDLEKKNLINDIEFANWWIEQRREFRPKGKRLLKIELLQKGIAKEIIDLIMSEDKNGTSEFTNALKIAQKRWIRIEKLSEVEKKKKLIGFLGSRGFTWDTISDVIDTLLKKD